MAATITRLDPDHLHRITQAIADPRRFAILQQIARESCLSCSALNAHADISPPTISHHLKTLHDAGLLDVAREGRTSRLTFQRDIWNAYLQQLAEL